VSRAIGTRVLLFAGGIALGGALAAGGLWATRPKVTFTEDIAPIVFAKCARCHRPEGAGPFSLLTYDEVAGRARDIRSVTRRRFMPPWRPVPGYAEYENDRSLTADQIDLIGRWVDGGAKRGDPAKMPKEPEWPKGWQLGEPDLIVQMPEAYTLPSDGRDVYRNFVIRPAVDGRHYVKAWEFRPGTRTIHHAILTVDRYGLARRRDEREPGMGFGGMDPEEAQSADGSYLVWTPGMVPAPPRPSMGWMLDLHTDLVLQLHMQPSGKPEKVRPRIGLYLSDEPPTVQVFTFRIGDPPIDIPPGVDDYVIHSEDVLAADVDVVSLFPHAHYLATKVRTWATLPDGTERGLLRIDDWDFNWQDEYVFAHPIALPAGTKMSMEFHYDNSAKNVRNPSHPPRRVVTGPNSTDEMGNVTFQLVPRGPGSMNRLREAKYRKWLAASDTARNHYNLANVLADTGNKAEAIAHYRRAVEENPLLAPACFNLGNLLLEAGDVDGAIAAFEGALRARADFADAHVNLGNALRQKGDMRGALEHYRDAVAADPKSAVAQNSLGLALDESGDSAGSLAHFRAALAIDPDNWRSRYSFGNALRRAGQTSEAILQYRRAVALRPDEQEPRRALQELESQTRDAGVLPASP
jgi:Flp pilus assembly protein TadD